MKTRIKITLLLAAITVLVISAFRGSTASAYTIYSVDSAYGYGYGTLYGRSFDQARSPYSYGYYGENMAVPVGTTYAADGAYYGSPLLNYGYPNIQYTYNNGYPMNYGANSYGSGFAGSSYALTPNSYNYGFTSYAPGSNGLSQYDYRNNVSYLQPDHGTVSGYYGNSVGANFLGSRYTTGTAIRTGYYPYVVGSPLFTY